MSNSANYFGLRPVRHINGSSWNGLTEKCFVGAKYSPLLYVGDPVTLTAEIDDADTTALYTSVILAEFGAGNEIYGVITSIDSSETMNDNYVKKPASTEAYINVCIDPTVVYHIRDDGGSTPDCSWPGLNADIIDAAAGSAITGLSGVGLSGASHNVTQNLQLHILRMANLPDNTLEDYAIWEVMINTHQLLNGGIAGNVLGIART